MAAVEDPWTLRETPFEGRLARLLDRVRREADLSWVGLVDCYDAPDGDLAPTWLAATPGPVPGQISPSEFAALSSGRLDDFPGPTGGYRAAYSIGLHTDVQAPNPLLLFVAEAVPRTRDVERLVAALSEGLSAWRRAQVADRVFEAVQQMPDPFEITDRDGRMTYANGAWREAFGHDLRDRYGDTVASLFRDGEAPVHDTTFYRYTMSTIQQGASWIGALACRTASGAVRFAEAHVGPFTAQRFQGNVAIRRDLSSRAERDSALARVHHEFRRVLSALPDGATVLRDGSIYFANPAFLEMVGRTEEDALGRRYESFVHPDDHRIFLEHARKTAVAVRISRSDGAPRIAEISMPGSLSFEGRPAMILMSRDVTDERIASEMLARAERLSALGSLSAGLAHEINNPLTYLTLSLYALRDDYVHGLGATAQQTLLEAISGAERIQRIVKELRSFSGKEGPKSNEVVDVSAAAQSALNIAQNEIRHRATLHRNLSTCAHVLAREGPLVQVLVSLLVNAAQAIPEGTVERSRIDLTVSTSDEFVRIVVKDTGVGIPKEILPKVFEPFYTSKARNEGSGLGLSIAKQIVEGFSGRIELDSIEGVGTTATVILPQTRPSEQRMPHSESAPTKTDVRLKILVIDDEVRLARAIIRLLPTHQVETAADYRNALQLVDEHGSFDVVLCDLMMPGRSGPELYKQITERRPELAGRFLFMTGGVFADGVVEFLRTWRLPVLSKPFEPEALTAAIQDIVLGKYGPGPMERQIE